MRRGEIVGLKWADRNRSTRRVSVRRTVQSVAGRPVEFDVKTRTSRRCVDLDPATITELDRWRRRLRLDGLPHGPDDWMFCNRSGRFLNPESVSQLFDRIVQRSDLPRIRFHDLRPHPCLAARCQRRTHHGRHRASRSRPSRLHDAHVPTPTARHERSRR
jgi:integrase